jgi:hypothetical protein
MFRGNLFTHYQALDVDGKKGRQSEWKRGRQIDRGEEVHRRTFVTFLKDAPQVRHFNSEFPVYYY